MAVIGWDIGGVNTKAARVRGAHVETAVIRPFELQRAPGMLAPLLRDVACDLDGMSNAAHAVTMTAELSQMFRTKREGVHFVLDAVHAAFGSATVHVYSTDGCFVTPAEARTQPLKVAAANWMATAVTVAARHRDALLVDVGTTTTDIIPLVAGSVMSAGRTDPERLASGELVYTGAVRTPAEALVSSVDIDGHAYGVSAEGFALVGDAHVWLGSLEAAQYSAGTPDGRPATPEFAGERLARVVCADREMLHDKAITAIADAIAAAQASRVADAIRRVRSRHTRISRVVVAGLGAFIARRAATAIGLEVHDLAGDFGTDGGIAAPAAAVALLLEEQLSKAAHA